MMDKTVLAISKTDADELRVQLESRNRRERDEAQERLADLLWEAVHCPPDLSWLQPSPHGA